MRLPHRAHCKNIWSQVKCKRRSSVHLHLHSNPFHDATIYGTSKAVEASEVHTLEARYVSRPEARPRNQLHCDVL